MLTPLDIRNKNFKRGFRGYGADEVDDFLDEVMKDFEGLFKENLELKEQLIKERDNVRLYKDLEDTLQKTMVLAQRVSEDAKISADKESELIIGQARAQAEQIIENAKQQITESIRRQDNLLVQEKQIIAKLKLFLRTQLEFVESNRFEETIQTRPEEVIYKMPDTINKMPEEDIKVPEENRNSMMPGESLFKTSEERERFGHIVLEDDRE